MLSALLIVPTRKRPEACEQLLEQFKQTAEISDIVFGIDKDDPSEYSQEIKSRSDINDRLRMGGTLNLLAQKYAPHYEYLAFMGDDHRPRTKGWDRILAEEIGDAPGIAYGNDLLQGANLPTAVMLSSSIVKKIGFMVPRELIHMYMDNFWLELGKSLGNCKYRGDVIIEHMHYLNNKAKPDALYMETNSEATYAKDSEAYHRYMTTQFAGDVMKILGI